METSMLSSEGRITRSTYWTRFLVAHGLLFLIGIFVGAMAAGSGARGGGGTGALLNLLSLPVSVFMIIQGTKRMHDVGRSGWYLLIPIYSLILLLSDGTVGPNQYGEDPKARLAYS